MVKKIKTKKIIKKQEMIDFNVSTIIKKGKLDVVILCSPPKPFKKGTEKQAQKILDSASLNIKAHIDSEMENTSRKLHEFI